MPVEQPYQTGGNGRLAALVAVAIRQCGKNFRGLRNGGAVT